MVEHDPFSLILGWEPDIDLMNYEFIMVISIICHRQEVVK